MKEYRITLIPGDGVGPEVCSAARECVDAVAGLSGFAVEWEVRGAGAAYAGRRGGVLPAKTISSVAENGIALKGPITTPVGRGFRSVNVEMRKRLGLFANVRPVRLFKGVKSRYRSVDLVVIRENTEDLYSGIEFSAGSWRAMELIRLVARSRAVIPKDSAIGLKTISGSASRRIAKFAFEYARTHRRSKVTAVHKANIMKFTDGLFLEAAQKESRKHPGIGFDDRIVDNLSMQLVMKPEQYDVLLCPNLYGDILSDLCAGLAGGLGLAPSANVGDGCAVFEPVHGSAPKHAGKNEVNPTACILSAVMMLEHIGERKAAKRLEGAALRVIESGRHVTYDLNPGRPATTSEMAEAIIERLD